MRNVCEFFKSGLAYVSSIAMMAAFTVACSDNDVAGGASGDAGVYAIKDLDVAGVSQKGPFVTGSAVTVQELDGITLKQTGKSFKGTIKSDKGDFAIKDINLQSQYAILEANGYYRDEISGKKSSGTVTLRALTDLSNRKTVNINLLTHLEYERVKYLVTEKKKSIADAKSQAEKEILSSFAIEGDFAESEDLNIFESGDGNAALLAVSVLMQSDVDVAGLTERMGEFSIALAEGGSWDDADTKTAIADWACDTDLKGTLANVRKNIENWKYADSVPTFEKYVTNFWWNNYGLGVCNAKRENETKRNVNKLSKLYNEYFVCENGRWVIPGNENSSSSVSASSSSSLTLSSSSAVSSSSIYNPFEKNAVPALPAELSFMDTVYRRNSFMDMGNDKQMVWFYSSKDLSDNKAQDSAASVLVKILGEKGFSFEGAIRNDSLRMSYYDDTSYVYTNVKDNIVYKVALTKKAYCFSRGFDIKVVVRDGNFEELPTNVSGKDSLPDHLGEMFFLKKFIKKKTEYTEYSDGKQVVWRGEAPACGTGCDSFAEELIGDAKEKGFDFSYSYSNDSLDNDYTEDSQVYTKTSNGKVYSFVITKADTRVCSECAGITGYCTPSGMYYIKIIVRDVGFVEIPTEVQKDYNSPKYREMPEDLKFIMDTTDHYYRSYSIDSLRTTWHCFVSIGWGNERLVEAIERAEEFAALMESRGFTLKSQEEHTLSELQSMGYNTNYYDSTPVTLYRFEKDVAKYRYVADVFPAIDLWTDNMVGTRSFLIRSFIQISIYDK